ncbi:MAG: hypothetical protein ACR2HE_10890, partial [Casimicrobiaceae bacterium]
GFLFHGWRLLSSRLPTGRWSKSSFQPKGYAAFFISTLFDRTSELVAALDLIAEHGRANKTLQMLQLEAKKQVVA